MPRAKIAGLVLLALQVAWIAREQLGPSRYFCWAPLHEHVWYRLEARVGGVALTNAEVARRYGRKGAFYDVQRGEFWELNAAQHVFDTVARREGTLALEQRASVSVRYRTNDRETRSWTYAP
jgi:hypothetical protein